MMRGGRVCVRVWEGIFCSPPPSGGGGDDQGSERTDLRRRAHRQLCGENERGSLFFFCGRCSRERNRLIHGDGRTPRLLLFVQVRTGGI